MTDHPDHDVNALVAKHLKALFTEATQTDQCELCVTFAVAASCVGTVLEGSGSTDTTKEFLQHVYNTAVMCRKEGRVRYLNADTYKNRMN